MNRVHNFHRKRPHILPPLTNSQSSLLRPVDTLQAPDLLLLENRLGSPAPRPYDPKEVDYFGNECNEKPMIKISGPQQKDNLMKFDLLSDSICRKGNNSPYQKEKMSKVPGLDLGRGVKENLLTNNFSKNELEKLAAKLDKNITLHSVEKKKNYESSEPKYFQIPNRYTLLKPIGEGMSKN